MLPNPRIYQKARLSKQQDELGSVWGCVCLWVFLHTPVCFSMGASLALSSIDKSIRGGDGQTSFIRLEMSADSGGRGHATIDYPVILPHLC